MGCSAHKYIPERAEYPEAGTKSSSQTNRAVQAERFSRAERFSSQALKQITQFRLSGFRSQALSNKSRSSG
jgi:hypothetical protein